MIVKIILEYSVIEIEKPDIKSAYEYLESVKKNFTVLSYSIIPAV